MNNLVLIGIFIYALSMATSILLIKSYTNKVIKERQEKQEKEERQKDNYPFLTDTEIVRRAIEDYDKERRLQGVIFKHEKEIE